MLIGAALLLCILSVPLLGGRKVLAHLSRHAGECGQPEHQGAKNGVLM